MAPSAPAPRALARLHAEIRSCRACVAAGYLPQAVPIVAGKASDRVMIIGQAPGAIEVTTGIPFSGRAGDQMRRWLARAGIADDRVPYRTSITKCFPGKNPVGEGDRRPSGPEIALCSRFLDRELALVRPDIVLLVGSLAIARFWGPGPLTEAVGRSRWSGEALLIPMPHPSGASRWLNDATHRRLLDRALGILAREAKRLA